jgi:hypothetical protein
VTGANAVAYIPLNGTGVVLGEAYGQTELEINDTLLVTNFAFVDNFQLASCVVIKNGTTEVAAISNPVRDFQTFSPTPLNWQSNFSIFCFRI